MNTFVTHTHNNISRLPTIGVGLGVGWYVWGVKGFWWGVLCGGFWPIWLGYHIAAIWVK
jgi:hypothetical protein